MPGRTGPAVFPARGIRGLGIRGLPQAGVRVPLPCCGRPTGSRADRPTGMPPGSPWPPARDGSSRLVRGGERGGLPAARHVTDEVTRSRKAAPAGARQRQEVMPG